MPLLAALAFAAESVARLPQPTAVVIGSADEELRGLDRGELLLGELNCLGCHDAPAAIKARFLPKPGPLLGEAGARLLPQGVRALLEDPFAEKPGTAMPHLLHGLEPGEKAEKVEALIHFLMAQGEPEPASPVPANPLALAQGRRLYHQVGCVACHPPLEPAFALFAGVAGGTPAEAELSRYALAKLNQMSVPLGNLARKYGTRELAKFLLDPVRVRPAGRMPAANLTEVEALALASYLLRAEGLRPPAPTEPAPPAAGGETLTVDLRKADRGREWFLALGCAGCHQLGGRKPELVSTLKAKPLLGLDLNNPLGCLAERPGTGRPLFRLTPDQRAALKATLAARDELARPLTAKERVVHTLAALNCYACHARDGLGGPTPSRADYFTSLGEADLGDEGRLPPHLGGVGGKLRPDWLREVLLNRGFVRPYLATRMPQFGAANVEPLIRAFAEADGLDSRAPEPPHPFKELRIGRRLVGVQGYSCISCHSFAGHKSLGISVMDLTWMAQRLQRPWFKRYVVDPGMLRPGTRMPSFFPDGTGARPEILAGDPDRQSEALWAFLLQGAQAALPVGLVQSRTELVATNEPLVFRAFIAGIGPRAIAVGFPQQVNLAFDSDLLRWGSVWLGPFLEPASRAAGGAGGFAPPLGVNLVELAAGPPFAVLADARTPWPAAGSALPGGRLRGVQTDAQGQVVIRYELGSLAIEDRPTPRLGEAEPELVRRLTLRAQKPITGLWMRGAAARRIRAQADGSHLVDGRLEVRFSLPGGGAPVIRSGDGEQELLVPLLFHDGEAKVVEEIMW